MSRRRSKTKKRSRQDEESLFDDPQEDLDSEWEAGGADDDELLDEDYDGIDDDIEQELPFSDLNRRRNGYRDMDDWN